MDSSVPKAWLFSVKLEGWLHWFPHLTLENTWACYQHHQLSGEKESHIFQREQSSSWRLGLWNPQLSGSGFFPRALPDAKKFLLKKNHLQTFLSQNLWIRINYFILCHIEVLWNFLSAARFEMRSLVNFRAFLLWLTIFQNRCGCGDLRKPEIGNVLWHFHVVSVLAKTKLFWMNLWAAMHGLFGVSWAAVFCYVVVRMSTAVSQEAQGTCVRNWYFDTKTLTGFCCDN